MKRLTSHTTRRRSSNSSNKQYQSLEPRRMLACDFSVGSPHSGIAVSDDATGVGFAMYSQAPVATRFGGLNANNADNFVAIQLDGSQWQYNNDSTWVDFEPVSGDVIVAELNFSADTVSMISDDAAPATIQSIPLAQIEGELWFAANRFGSADDVGEFAMLGDCTTTDLSTYSSAGLGTSEGRLSQLAFGALHFEAVVGEFPNLAIFDDAGSPLLSWRVQILPFIGMQDLYSQFNIDEAWDSANNIALLDQMPDVFVSEHFESATQTVFQALGGENTVFPLVSDNIGFGSISDGSSNTLLFVEANASRAVEWTRPVDLTFLPDNPLSGVGDIASDGFSVVTASGGAFTIPGDIDPTNFANMAMRNDGEVVDFSEFSPFGDEATNLRQITLAAHNYESSYRKFPTHAIYSDAGVPLLSWRVTILPFIEQNNLYEQFHLDEAWDSAHNLSLLPFMPRFYATEGLATGFTNYVGVSGPGTMFELSEDGFGFGGIFDGSSNTIMFVAADPNQIAFEWTKPADLVFDAADPTAGLGATEVGFNAAFADVSVHFVSSPDEMNLTNMMLRNDGEFVDFTEINPYSNTASNLRQVALAAHNFDSAYKHLPRDLYDPTTTGEPALLSWRVQILPFIEQGNLYNKFDLNASWDSPQNLALIPFMPRIFATEGVPNGMTVVQGSKGANTLFPGTEDDKIGFGSITDGSSNTAMILHVDASEAVEWTKPDDLAYDPASARDGLGNDSIGFWAAMGDASVRFIDNTVRATEMGYFLERSDGFSYMTNHLKPKASSIALDRITQNNMRQIALAWHNYESAHQQFPTHAIYTNPPNRGGEPLLSWRVSILPYLEQGDLWAEFRKDEAWDSEHNLSLLKYMPDLFSHSMLNSVDGMTIMQTVNGPWDTGEPTTMSPLANVEIGFGDVIDGSSNTLMFTEANLDQAVAWTKPEDILFDPANPKFGMGEIEYGFGHWAAIGDGSVHFVSNCGSDEAMSNFILMNDGNGGGLPSRDGGYCNNGIVLPSFLGGTPGSDSIQIVMLDDVVQVTMNGDEFEYARVDFARLVIDAGLGIDDVTLIDGSEDNIAEFSPTRVFVTGDLGSFSSVLIENGDDVSVTSGGGDDYATMRGAGLDIQFFGTPDSSVLLTGESKNRVSGYGEVVAFGGAGNDRAYFADSTGDDTFIANPSTAEFESESGMVVRANDFELFSATSSNGGLDSAVLTDSIADERFFGSRDLSRMIGDGYIQQAIGFGSVLARTVGGDDSAVLMDSTGNDVFFAKYGLASMVHEDGVAIRAKDYLQVSGFSRNGGDDVAILTDEGIGESDDDLIGSPDSVVMYVAGAKNVAAGFGQVNSRSTSGNDSAFLIGSAARENFYASPTAARMVNDQFFNLVLGFNSVDAFSNGGGDRAILLDSAGDDSFFSSPTIGSLKGDSYQNSARSFSDVRAVGTTGLDTASFEDSAAQEFFHSTPNASSMSGGSFFNHAQGFDNVTAYSSNASDVAYLRGSVGDDRLSVAPGSSGITGAGFGNYAIGFATVNAFGNTGNDTASISDSNGDDNLFAIHNQLRLTGRQDGVEQMQFIDGFETVFANGINGGTNEFETGFFVAYDLFRNGSWV